jgi:hypothetical protein
MKASELRLNNLIEVDGNTTCLHTNYDLFVALVKISSGNEDYQPIVLTKEWLLALGFARNKEHGYFEFDRFIVAYNDLVDSFYLCDIDVFVQIETVHHLQNLYFAIRNKELTLKP